MPDGLQTDHLRGGPRGRDVYYGVLFIHSIDHTDFNAVPDAFEYPNFNNNAVEYAKLYRVYNADEHAFPNA